MKNLLFLVACLLWSGGLFAQTNYVATSPGSNTPGVNNTIVGINAGSSVVDAQRNVMVGTGAGLLNKSARNNVYMGYNAASKDTSSNLFGGSVYIGSDVGFNLKHGDQSVLIGYSGGFNLNLLEQSVIIGYNAAGSSRSSFANVLIGDNVATSYTNLRNSVCVGELAGTGRTGLNPKTGDRGTYIGHQSGGADGLSGATAIGADAFVTQSNSLILGSKGVLVGIGNSAPHTKLEITALDTNQSGLRFTHLTTKSPVTVNNGKVLSVNKEGDVILTSGTDLSAVLTRLDALEKANAAQAKLLAGLQQANADLTKRVTKLEGQRVAKK